MKKLIALFLGSALLLTGCGGGATSEDAIAKYGSDTLKFYNWGEYIGDDVIETLKKNMGLMLFLNTLTLMRLCTLKFRLVISTMFLYHQTI